uniref:Uncharacterized protein n=1 Tax=Bionectria ochroleuca TaxID=29856 RepID=A0A8H7NML6_BIOOC
MANRRTGLRQLEIPEDCLGKSPDVTITGGGKTAKSPAAARTGEPACPSDNPHKVKNNECSSHRANSRMHRLPTQNFIWGIPGTHGLRLSPSHFLGPLEPFSACQTWQPRPVSLVAQTQAADGNTLLCYALDMRPSNAVILIGLFAAGYSR